jgi:hypothetical protein
MSLWNKIKNNLDDVSAFGPQIIRRHISRATGVKPPASKYLASVILGSGRAKAIFW